MTTESEHLDQDPEQRDKAIKTAKKTTKNYARGLWAILTSYGKIDPLKTKKISRIPPQKTGSNHSTLLAILSAVPYLLIVLFLVSFAWDFNDMEWIVLGNILQFEGLLKIISVSGLIGYLTNWLAITMLFKPAQKRPLLGHGLIPAQKERIAYRLAQTVSEDLINPEIIKERIHQSQLISKYRQKSTEYIKQIIDNPEFRLELKNWALHYMKDMLADPEIRTAMAQKIIQKLHESLRDKSFERVALKAYSFVKGQEMQKIVEEALIKLPESVESGLDKMDDLLDQLPQAIDQNSDQIEEMVTSLLYKLINRLDVHALVEDNLRSYDEQKLSGIIRGATNEQLNYIQYLGAVLGLIGGFIIWEPLLSVTVFGTILVIILLTDSLLFNYVLT